MKTTRRDFMTGAGLLGAALALGSNPLVAAPSVEPAPTLKGKLYAFGMGGSKYPGNEQRAKDTTSILTSFDLETRAIKQTSLELGDGHAAMGALDGRILCVGHHRPTSMMVDKDHNILATYTAPEGMKYSGHGLVFPERNIFILPLRTAKQRTKADVGKFEVYDLTSLKKIDETGSSGGILPHEIRKVPNNPNELAVTHYGNIQEKNKPLEFNIIDSKLTILDSKTFTPLRHYDQNEFNALTTHMRISNDGWAYIVLTQFIQFELLNRKEGQSEDAAAREELERIFKQKWDYETPKVAFEEKHLPVGLPFLRINTQTGERQIIFLGSKHHMHSQSVAFNVATNTAVGLYYESDNLILHTPGKDAEIIPHDKLKLKAIRGVTEIPGTTMIGVCGTFNDISVFDLKTREVVTQFTSRVYYSTHLYHEADV